LREIIPAVLSPGECKDLAATVDYLQLSDPRIAKVLGTIREYTEVTLDDPSYCRVEDRREGHPWHSDVGNNSHMDWCKTSARVLLDPVHMFDGGAFYFRDEHNLALFGTGDLILYSTDDRNNEHMVARSNGTRRVLLMFLANNG